MKTRQRIVSQVLWVGLGAAAMLVAGCAGLAAHPRIALTGTQEVPPVTTTASGATDIAVEEFKCPSAASSGNCPTLMGMVTTSGIAGTAAAVHQGAAGQNGPAIVQLVKTTDTAWSVPPGTTLTAAQAEAYRAGQLYVIVASSAHPGGEIRAQLRP